MVHAGVLTPGQARILFLVFLFFFRFMSEDERF